MLGFEGGPRGSGGGSDVGGFNAAGQEPLRLFMTVEKWFCGKNIG
jgi:hypothetical protein